MSKELVRFKYKKDIINCVEESWAYYGKEDEQRKVIKELKNVYKISSSAQNAPKPEYEAKAKAFDAVIRSYDYAPSYSQIGEDVMIIVNKYRSELND